MTLKEKLDALEARLDHLEAKVNALRAEHWPLSLEDAGRVARWKAAIEEGRKNSRFNAHGLILAALGSLPEAADDQRDPTRPAGRRSARAHHPRDDGAGVAVGRRSRC